MPWTYIAIGGGVLFLFPRLLQRITGLIGTLAGQGIAGAVGAVGELAGEAADALTDSPVGAPGGAIGEWLYEAVHTGPADIAEGAESAEDQTWTPMPGPGAGDWWEITENT